MHRKNTGNQNPKKPMTVSNIAVSSPPISGRVTPQKFNKEKQKRR